MTQYPRACRVLPGLRRGPGQRPAQPERPGSQWLVSVSILLGSIMATIDTSVAWLSSVLGRKRMYMGCVVIFTAASALCGLSRSLGQLIAFRVLQGLGGGALQPTSQAVIRETFPVRQQAQAQGLFGMLVLLGPALGPTLGGYLVDNYSWPWIFYVNGLAARGIDVARARLQALALLGRKISAQAAVVAFNDAFAVMAALFLFCLPLVLLLRRGERAEAAAGAGAGE